MTRIIIVCVAIVAFIIVYVTLRSVTLRYVTLLLLFVHCVSGRHIITYGGGDHCWPIDSLEQVQLVS